MSPSKIHVLHPLVSFNICQLLGVPALEACVEEVVDPAHPMAEVGDCQVSLLARLVFGQLVTDQSYVAPLGCQDDASIWVPISRAWDECIQG